MDPPTAPPTLSSLGAHLQGRAVGIQGAAPEGTLRQEGLDCACLGLARCLVAARFGLGTAAPDCSTAARRGEHSLRHLVLAAAAAERPGQLRGHGPASSGRHWQTKAAAPGSACSGRHRKAGFCMGASSQKPAHPRPLADAPVTLKCRSWPLPCDSSTVTAGSIRSSEAAMLADFSLHRHGYPV